MKTLKSLKKLGSLKNARGQGLSEYLIIVALIAVASIAVIGLFGGTARQQVAGLALEISGTDSSTVVGNAATTAGEAETDADTDITLSTYSDNAGVIGGGGR